MISINKTKGIFPFITVIPAQVGTQHAAIHVKVETHQGVIPEKSGIHSINRPASFFPSPWMGEGQGRGERLNHNRSFPPLRSLISILFIIGALISTAWTPGNAIAGTETSPDQKALSFAVSPDWVKAKLNKTPKPVIIDVRRPDEFAKYSIPQSINLPLYAIKTKLFLRNKQVILINEGFDYMMLAEEAQRLKQSGYSVSILYGGLNAWQKSGTDLSGDVFAQEEIAIVSAQSLYRQKAFSNLKIIDVSKKPVENFNNGLSTIYVPLENLSGYLITYYSQLRKASRKNTGEFQTLLIVNGRGSDYERIKQIVDKAEIQNVFYLTGGLLAYKQHIENVSLAMAPIEDRLVTKGACDSCVK